MKLDQKKYSLNRNKINFKSPTDEFACILRNWTSHAPGHRLMRMDAWRRIPGGWPGGAIFKKEHFSIFKCVTKLSTETECCCVLLQSSKIRRMCRITRRQVRFHMRKKILIVHVPGSERHCIVMSLTIQVKGRTVMCGVPTWNPRCEMEKSFQFVRLFQKTNSV